METLKEVIEMIKIIMVLLLICLTIVIGAAYFVIWPMAQQFLAAANAVLQPALANMPDALPALPQDVALGIEGLIALLPILERLGMEGITQIQQLATGGITGEEAQQALDILRNQLSEEQLRQLRTLLNIQ